jgi:AraC-like DNA-binding protein
MFYIAGISIAFFLLFLLITKKGKTQADHILTAWVLVMGTHLLLFYAYSSGYMYRYPSLLAVGTPLPLLHGPFLFLYTASLTNQHRHIKWWWLHFMPALLCWIYLIQFFILPAAQKIYVFQHKGIGYETFNHVNLVAIIASGISYVAWSLVLLRRHRRAILDQFSDTEQINLAWLRYLVYGIAVIWLLVFASDELLFTAVVIFIFLMGYFGMKQPGIFTTQPPEAVHTQASEPGTVQRVEQPAMEWPDGAGSAEDRAQLTVEMDTAAEPYLVRVQDDGTGKKKYAKSGLSETQADNLHRQLTGLMTTEKVFTESELSLAQLADRLGTLPNYLSQVINEKEGKTFYDYINTLRIEEFKSMLADPANKKYTLLTLSFECGFNSKSSFNKNFKKATGLSPTEYAAGLNQQ